MCLQTFKYIGGSCLRDGLRSTSYFEGLLSWRETVGGLGINMYYYDYCSVPILLYLFAFDFFNNTGRNPSSGMKES